MPDMSAHRTVSRRHAPKALLVDLFGTLVGPFPQRAHRELLARMAEQLSIPAPAFTHHFEMTATEAMSGRLPTVAQHITHVAAFLAASLDGEALTRVVELHGNISRQWLTPREGALSVLASLSTDGVRLGLVSNCSGEVPQLWPVTPMGPLFDEALFSCQERLVKPDVAIFERAVGRLGVAPGEAVYVSDGPLEELEAAASIGVTPVLFDAPDLDPDRLQGRAWGGLSITSFGDLARLLGIPWRSSAVPHLRTGR